MRYPANPQYVPSVLLATVAGTFGTRESCLDENTSDKECMEWPPDTSYVPAVGKDNSACMMQEHAGSYERYPWYV